MTQRHIKVGSALIALSLVVLPLSALAKDGVSGEVQGSTGVEAETGSSGAGISGGGNASAGVKVDSWGVVSSDDGETRGKADMDSDTDFEVSAADATAASTTIDAPERVTTRGELRAFLNHLVKADDRVADVHVSSTTVETSYEIPAKFLWVIPASISANVAIENDGTVTVKYPWYAFLFATAKSKDDIRTVVQEQASSTVGTSAQATLSASTQAHLLNAVFAALKTSVEAGADVSAK